MDQVIDYDATIVERLRDAGAVLVAKLTLGALAQGDGGSAARRRIRGIRSADRAARRPGPGSATAAGCVAFAIGTETRGSILSPSSRQRRRRPAADVRPRQPLRRDGAVDHDGQGRTDVPLRRGHGDRAQRDLRSGQARRQRRRRGVHVESGHAARRIQDRLRRRRRSTTPAEAADRGGGGGARSSRRSAAGAAAQRRRRGAAARLAPRAARPRTRTAADAGTAGGDRGRAEEDLRRRARRPIASSARSSSPSTCRPISRR